MILCSLNLYMKALLLLAFDNFNYTIDLLLFGNDTSSFNHTYIIVLTVNLFNYDNIGQYCILCSDLKVIKAQHRNNIHIKVTFSTILYWPGSELGASKIAT